MRSCSVPKDESSWDLVLVFILFHFLCSWCGRICTVLFCLLSWVVLGMALVILLAEGGYNFVLFKFHWGEGRCVCCVPVRVWSWGFTCSTYSLLLWLLRFNVWDLFRLLGYSEKFLECSLCYGFSNCLLCEHVLFCFVRWFYLL